MHRILVVDDERSIRIMLEEFLQEEGFEVVAVGSGKEALNLLEGGKHFEVAITDIRMPEIDGLELLRLMLKLDPLLQVIMITAYTSKEGALEAMSNGAYDYIAKPFDLNELKELVLKAIEKRRLLVENKRLKAEIHQQRGIFVQMVGRSEPMLRVFELIRQVAPTKSTVLITGESGTGKELAARAIHELSPRADKPFVPINCGAIPKELIESELFGYVKGAFTGATTDKRGLFVQGSGGTVFLDEIGELPLNLQVKLLRVLDEKKVRPVGSNTEIPVDVRVIAATNKDLRKMVEEGTFREDLFYRLNVISIHMPPLRERRDDIPRLVHYFLERSCREMNRPPMTLSPEAMEALMNYSFPGNVRELMHIIERAVVLSRSSVIERELIAIPEKEENRSVEDKKRKHILLPSLENSDRSIDLESVLETVERYYLEEALKLSGGVKTKAAKLLGLSLRSLRYRLERLGIGKGSE